MSKSNNFFHNLIKPFKFGSTRGKQQNPVLCFWIFLFFCNNFVVFFLLEGNSEDDIQNIATQEQRTFSYVTLVAATNNFHVHNKLGQGGFGPVYKVNIFF